MRVQGKQEPEAHLTYVTLIIPFMDKDALNGFDECLEQVFHIYV